jgi:hypothetical protein
MKSGSQIFVLFLSTQVAAAFLEKAYEKGMLHDGTQVIASSDCLAADIIASLKSKQDVSKIFRGFFTIRHDPSYSMNEQAGVNFVSRFNKLKPTKFIDKTSGISTCPIIYDSTGLTEMYAVTLLGSRECIGISSFSNYSSSNMDPNTQYVYDSVYTIAHAADSFIKQYGFDTFYSPIPHTYLRHIFPKVRIKSQLIARLERNQKLINFLYLFKINGRCRLNYEISIIASRSSC